MKRILYTLIGVMFSVGAWAQTSLQEQINSAEAGTTITLTENITVSQTILIDKNITIDGAGYTITSSVNNKLGAFYVNTGTCNFNIQNATIDGNSEGSMAVVAYRGKANAGLTTVDSGDRNNNNSGNVITLTGCTVKNFTGYPESFAGAVYAFSTSTVNLTNCTFSGNTTSLSADGASGADVWAGAAATVNINGGSYQEVFVNSDSSNESKVTIEGNATVAELAVCASYKADGSTNIPTIVVDNSTVTTLNTETGNPIPANDIQTMNGGSITNVPAIEVAKIYNGKNTKAYSSLADAVAAAQSGETVTLLADITVSTVDEISVTKKLTLDLAGKKITSTVSEPIIVKGTGDLTITGNGTIAGPEGEAGKALDGKAMITVEGTLTYVNGTLTCGGVGSDGMYGVYVLDGGSATFGDQESKTGPTIASWFAAIGENNTTSPANITIYGGNYTSKASPSESDWWSYFCAPIYAAASGTINISGGEFNGYYGLSSRYGNVNQDLNINGGTFNGSKSALFIDNKSGVASSETRDVAVSDGTFSSAVPEEYCADGFIPEDNGDGTFGVKEGSYVARIGGQGYETLAAAIAAATEGQTVSLISDIALDKTTITVNNDKNFILDLNGKTVSFTSGKIDNKGTLTIKSSVDGGKITKSAGGYVISNAADADLTLESGTIELTGKPLLATTGALENKGELVINGGKVTAKQYAVYCSAGSETTINGGNITSSETSAVYLGGGSCEITAGTFNSADGFVNVTLFKGELKAQESVTNNANATFTSAKSGYVYAIAGAISLAGNNEVITLLKDINATAATTFDNVNSITLDLNGHNITSTKTAIKVTKGTLTITGEGVVKGANPNAKSTKTDPYSAVWANGGKVIINGGTFDEGGVDGSGNSTIYADKTSAVTINGGTFKNDAMYDGDYWLLNVDQSSTASIVAKGGTFHNFDPANNVNDDKPENGGTNYVADGYITECDKYSPIYTVKVGQWVALIKDEAVKKFRYTSLDEAIDDAKAAVKDITVTLLTNAETEKETLPANVTIDANSKVLTMPSFVVLDDGEAFTLPNVTGADTYKVRKATYIRTNISTTVWGTVCLPFSLTSGNGATYYTYNNISGTTLTVDETTTTVAPNTPVVFHKAAGDLEINEANATVSLANNPSLTSGALVGTYSEANITADGNIYFINGDKFHQAQVSVKVPAYRAYIKYTAPSSAAPRMLSIIVGGENNETGVEAIAVDGADINAVYDMAGRKMQAPRKGMSIVKLANGKTVKLFVK